jgi:hypothetical protein
MEVRRSFDYRNFEWNFFRFPYSFSGCGAGNARFAMIGGIRYFRGDEGFSFFSDDNDTIPGGNRSAEFIYASEVENHLAGVQIGSLMYYPLTTNLEARFTAKTGIYRNRMESRKAITDGDGNYATFGSGGDIGRDFNISSEKEDVAFLTEADLGLAYRLNHKWRLIGGYRVFALAGYADAAKQIPATFDGINSAGLIHDQSSLILHGGYIGAEFIW